MVTDVLVVGNVAEDLVDGVWVPGGPSLYASHVARALGARVILLTTLSPSFPRDAVGPFVVRQNRGSLLPRYENTYAPDGSRTQLLHETGDSIPAPVIREAIRMTAADVVYFAPAYHELPSERDITSDGVVGISLQGPLRDRDGLRVQPVADVLGVAVDFVSPGSWAFFSTEDAGGAGHGAALAWDIAARGASAIMTDGDHGITVFRPAKEPEYWAAVPARVVVDPTGAGDTFAISFLLYLAETGDEHLAIRFALAASSLAVERRGVQNIPTRGEIESRAQMAGAA